MTNKKENTTAATIETPEVNINIKQVGISKVAIATAYKDEMEKLVEKANTIITLQTDKAASLEEKVKAYETEGGSGADLKATIELLEEIAKKKDKSVEELKSIVSDIETAKEKLNSLEIFKDEAFDLVALTNTKNLIIDGLETQIAEIESEKKEILKRRAEEEKELAASRKIEEKEYDANLKKTRTREEEEYKYNFKIQKRTRTNELETELKELETVANDKATTIVKTAKDKAATIIDEATAEAKETRIAIEDELRVHDRKVEEFEGKLELFEELKEKVESFPEELKEAVSTAVKSAEGKAKGMNDSKIKSLEEKNEISIEAKNREIEVLNETIKELKAAVTKAEARAEKAMESMTDIANTRSKASSPQVIVQESAK